MEAFNKNNAASDREVDYSIMCALSRDYSAVLTLNTDTGEFCFRKATSSLAKSLEEYGGQGHSFEDVVERFLEDGVVAEYSGEVRRTLSIGQMKEKFAESDYYSTVAECESGDVRRYIRVEVFDFSAELPNVAVIAVKDVDSAVRKEIEAQQQIKKAYFEAERYSLAKNQFLHNISHDIRTPLNAIVGYTTVAIDNIEDSNAVRKYLKKIDDASQILLHIINEILDLGELETGKIRLTESKLTMADLLEQLSDNIQAMIKDKQIDFEIRNNDKSNETLLIDVFHVNRVLTNLISNAVKFSEVGGEVSLTVTSSKSMKPNSIHYTFVVADRGQGISAEFLDRLFKPFEREKTSTKSRKKGIGLGLTITKNILDALGGTIAAESEQGKGSVFTVELDAEIAPSTDEDEAKRQALVKENPIKDKRILVVDDSKVNRDIAMAILESFEADVECVSDGDVAVEAVKGSDEGYFDLILMDIQMPQMDGYEATMQIRALNRQDVSTVPIVALTADVFDDTKQDAIACGMNDFLGKPINVKALKEVLIKQFTK